MYPLKDWNGSVVYRDGKKLYKDVGGLQQVAFRTVDKKGNVFYFTADEPVLLDDGWALPCNARGEKVFIKSLVSQDQEQPSGEYGEPLGEYPEPRGEYPKWRQSKDVVLYSRKEV